MALAALAEDIGPGDLTAPIVPIHHQSQGRVIVREDAVVCGQPWFEACCQALDPNINVRWRVSEGSRVHADDTICDVSGLTQGLLASERTALNFLQLMSGIATAAAQWATAAHAPLRVLDTRKTLPLLRYEQKYAVTIGGCDNHRFGLFDAAMLKENHIKVAGGITAAVQSLRDHSPEAMVICEVETLTELEEACAAQVDVALIDNLPASAYPKAVALANRRTVLEVSGNLTPDNLKAASDAGIARASVGALTKHVRAIDYSMRLSSQEST